MTVERSTAGFVRPRQAPDGLELRVLGRGPRLLSFGRPELSSDGRTVECRYPITGGMLARFPAGAITFAQHGDGDVEVSSRSLGSSPASAAKPGRPHWTGALYAHVQSRLHVAISRRYFENLSSRYRQVRVVVFGATGVIGSALAPALVAAGHDVVAVSRRSARTERRRSPWARADVTDPAAVARVLEGAEVVYYLVHSLGSKDFERRDRSRPRVVAGEAEAAGVQPDRLSRRLRRRRPRPLAAPAQPARDRRPAFGASPFRSRRCAQRWSSARAAPPSRRSSRSSTACPR